MAPEILRLAAFTDVPEGGNPAGVVLDAATLSDAEMQAIAAEVGYSETAFVTASGDPRGCATSARGGGAVLRSCDDRDRGGARRARRAGRRVLHTRAGASRSHRPTDRGAPPPR